MVMPIQKTAVSRPVSTSIRRKRFLRTAMTITAMAESRKPSSGQNRRALNTLFDALVES